MTTQVFPQDAETARALLDAAASLGLPPSVVRTSQDSFSVPDEVAEAYRKSITPTPRSRRRKAAEKE